MAEITVRWPSGLVVHGGKTVHEVRLREPTFDEYLTYGQPFDVQRSADGAPVFVEYPEAIRGYLDVLVVSPDDPALVKQGGYRLARALKDALFGFFLDGGVAEESTTSPTTSSSPVSTGSTPPLSLK